MKILLLLFPPLSLSLSLPENRQYSNLTSAHSLKWQYFPFVSGEVIEETDTFDKKRRFSTFEAERKTGLWPFSVREFRKQEEMDMMMEVEEEEEEEELAIEELVE